MLNAVANSTSRVARTVAPQLPSIIVPGQSWGGGPDAISTRVPGRGGELDADVTVASKFTTSAVPERLPHLVFVYGTLLKGRPNHHVMNTGDPEQARFAGRARTVEPMKLVIGEYGVPYMLPTKDFGAKRVFGEVYRCCDLHLDILDRFESCPERYRRIEVDVQLVVVESESIPRPLRCFVYVKPSVEEDLKHLPAVEEYPVTETYVPRHKRSEAWKRKHLTQLF